MSSFGDALRKAIRGEVYRAAEIEAAKIAAAKATYSAARAAAVLSRGEFVVPKVIDPRIDFRPGTVLELAPGESVDAAPRRPAREPPPPCPGCASRAPPERGVCPYCGGAR